MTKKQIPDMTFEQALQELEGLVRKLEEGKIPLEEAIEAYERGTQLRQHCEAKLKSAQMKVEQVMLNASGEQTSSPFSPSK